MGNPNLLNCKNIPTGTKLCLPFPCTPIYTLKDGDTYSSIERSLGLPYSAGYNIRKYNPWITCRPSNIYDASVEIYGTTLCGGPQGGIANGTTPPSSFDYGFEILPPTNVTVAEGTTYRCARWYIVGDQDVDEKTACTKLCLQKSIDWKLFLAANPSLATGVCDEKLVVGSAYCIEVSPNYIDHDDEEEGEDNEDDDVS
ncbi:uncharacterized protein KD926_003337 [Aspergillus affinis]|uniref:uncharacterized protein n=1 Tax=Aspergillus affinis TaxID=1070780 RepID=UPI0022FDFF94|nr:uncharacterized protein KD926_003337 [Aspergillus affinis]KAI9043567.1 hypothetical protein KD926_003337 [Aspergillus affinis]